MPPAEKKKKGTKAAASDTAGVLSLMQKSGFTKAELFVLMDQFKAISKGDDKIDRRKFAQAFSEVGNPSQHQCELLLIGKVGAQKTVTTSSRQCPARRGDIGQSKDVGERRGAQSRRNCWPCAYGRWLAAPNLT
eukprot:6207502-Pleurochrysis_carterae.AAC.3